MVVIVLNENAAAEESECGDRFVFVGRMRYGEPARGSAGSLPVGATERCADDPD